MNLQSTILVIYALLCMPIIALSQESSDTTKVVLDRLARNQIRYLSNGATTKYLEAYSENYTDLGGGPNRDGTVDFDTWKAAIDDFVSSKAFDLIKGQPIDKIVDVEHRKIMDYHEIVEERGEIKRFSFELKEGDYLVIFPVKEDSLLHEGWFGFFRLINGNWKIVAGD